jgi:AraC-like DNA-binding protein
MSVVPGTAKVPAPRRGSAAAERSATEVVMVGVRFRCAPGLLGRPLRHWQLGRARLIYPGLASASGADAGDLSARAVVVVPAADLGLPAEVIRRAMQTLSDDLPVYGLLQEHVARVFRDAGEISRSGAGAMVGRATIELVRALVSSSGRDPDGSAGWDHALEARLAAYIGQHLRDPGLRADELARVHGISVRQLYKLWSSRDISLSQWIVHKRLEGARAELGGAGHDSAAIATVAGRWGFASTTHFSRRFRDAYGMSPRQWQLAHERRER